MLFRVSEVELSAARARELLHYEAETGIFTWAVNRRGPAKAGDVAGTRMKNGYRKIGIDGREYLCHRLAWLVTSGSWPAHQIDHINGDPGDNRLENLRPATNAENHQNLGLRKTNTSGHVGVTWFADRGKWVAQIHVAGKHKCLGYFDDKLDASTAYRKAKAELHPFSPSVRT